MQTRNDGKNFEAIVQEVLEARKRKLPSYYIRLYDTHSAGSLLPAQPGDFILFERSHAFLIEAKSSIKHSSLRSCLSSHVDKRQAAKAKLFCRSGNSVIFLFMDMNAREVEIWPGHHVIDCRMNGKRLNPSTMYTRVDKSKLSEALTTYFVEREM